MPVIAHCEHGLIIDVFGESPVIIKSDLFKANNNRAVSFFKDTLKFIDLRNPLKPDELQIPSICELQISSDGSKVGAYSHERVLHVFDDIKIIKEYTDVEFFGISNRYYCIKTENKVEIYDFQNEKMKFQVNEPIKSIHVLDNMVFMVTEKSESQKLLVFKDNKIRTVLNLPNIYRAVFNSNSSEERILLLIDTEYTKSSYYADSTLFLLSYSDFRSVEDSCVQNEKLSKSQIPDVFVKTDDFIVLKYNSLFKIHSVGFLKNSFYVCFGDQPASLYRFTQDGKFLEKYQRTIRNMVAFNKKENRIINAGLGNLPGNIEVYSNQTTCAFELLGSSIVSWLNNGCYFMVAITNYFKSENKIAIYDYYGRLKEEMACKSLSTACVYGEVEDEVEVEKPDEIIKTKHAAAYIPPHLQSKQFTTDIKKPVIKKPTQTRTKEVVEKELQDALVLRERLKNGEDLSLDEQNRVFKIKSLEEEFSKLNF